ncbi:DUF3369 domain-containing protein [Alteromonas gilva]|uniref:DUF3369 domain-containing protein n=1 Tax=Alteromonas gilva TaxID=2987522 RepID=A0ABT5L3E3_9ALTE|nr:DUF3369 domain-containing protein [Alteromonas gilva]MDC8830377.1 DUF3369 domain-containing protein [Alteromonas gilva]
MTLNPLFASQTNAAPSNDSPETEEEYGYKVLIVDDEVEVHKVTELILKRFRFDGKRIQYLHAYSAEEALQCFEENKDIALALVDVVMETEHAGLDLVHKVRNDLNNHLVRLVLRTGQPGQAPEHQVIERYDINDYKEKTELTSQKLKTLMYSGLRSYRDIQTIDMHRKGLRQVIESTSKVLKPGSMSEFATAVLKEILNLLQIGSSALYCTAFSEAGGPVQKQVLAATGSLANVIAEAELNGLPAAVREAFDHAMQTRSSFYFENGYVFYAETDSGYQNLLYVDTNGELTSGQRELLDIYCFNVALTYVNLLRGQEILDTQRELVYLLGDAVEMRSKETGAHVKRVSLVSYRLAQLYGLPEATCLLIKQASPLHDFGKVAIPDQILHKPGKLDEEEWEIMKTHASVGYDILRKSNKPILQVAATICLTHHERWNGQGYPTGAKEQSIPIAGRITALADVFDALGSKRCYKEPWGRDNVQQEISAQRGEHFDPVLVDLLLAHFDEFWQIRERYPD